MSAPFESLPTTPRAEELIDTAFSRAARAGRAKDGVEAQFSMLETAANVLSDNLEHVVASWPDFDALDPFHRELADAAVAGTDLGGVDPLREHLSTVGWAGRQTADIKNEYAGRIRTGSPETARKLRKQAFARLADVTRQAGADLEAVATARETLKRLPELRPDEPAIVVAGYPNVGKSTFVNRVTAATNETAAYPFTTTRIAVGHVERDRVRYQLVDTPGLLDRPAAERNEVEAQAVSALTHLADAVVLLVDASGACGYPLPAQLALRAELCNRFDVPLLTVCNKSDRSRDVEADHYMSAATGEGVEAVLAAAVEAIDHEPELPFER